jgi:ABC-type multidrug transport system fused ATPase/permease subunit
MHHESAGYAHALTTYNALQQAPRLVLESIGFITIIGLVMFVITRYAHFETIIPILSLYAFAFYRLLPSINKILAGLNQTTFSQKSVLELEAFYRAKTEQLGTQLIIFTNSINIKDLSFSYQPEKPVLKNISCTIKKGQKVAFVGSSGSGKSTLVDILMGMYPTKQESIFIDGVAINDSNRASWRQEIGYIPQSIYLFDGTVKDNVVFGRPYDQERLYKALENAHILAFLMSQQGLETHVGEGGIALSGGQKQRIAIARALYANPEILVLDEATSALDHETESLIMQEMYGLSGSITLIVIAHRITTIAQCDVIFEISNGGIQEISYNALTSVRPAGLATSEANEHIPLKLNNQ